MFRSMKPNTLLSPVPAVMVSCCGETGGVMRDNILTVAWAGTICSDPPMVSISVRKSRFSYRLIDSTGEFVINLVGEELCEAADLCGVKSGADVDKFKAIGAKPVPAEGLSFAKAISAAPAYLSCKVKNKIELGSHDMFIAEVVACAADEKLFDGDRLALERAKLVSYSHGEYFGQGGFMGFFGYSVAAPDVRKRRFDARAGRG